MRHVNTENILNYLDGNATAAEKSKLETHLAVCAECLESKTQIQALVHRLRMEPRYKLSESAVQAMGNDELKVIAAELVTKVRQSVTIDWTVRESARAKIKVMVKWQTRLP